MVARLIAILVVMGGIGAAQPSFKKPSQLHAEAVRAHLGLGRRADLAAAVKLYTEACAQKYPPSCNNLAVLAVAGKTSSEKPEVVFAAACKKLDSAACENERRLGTHREAVLRLSLIPAIALDDKARGEQHALACKAGDLFECDDPTTKAWVGKVLADECRSGHPAECADAGRASADATEQLGLFDAGCMAKDARACFEYAARRSGVKAQTAWGVACTDADWPSLASDRADRLTACRQWFAPAKALAAVEAYCKAGEDDACMLGVELADRLGHARRAFELTKLVCERTPTATGACEALGARYLTGDGTARAIDKRIELLGQGCAAPTKWADCKVLARYEESHAKADMDPIAIYQGFCTGGEREACYLATRWAETNPVHCRGLHSGSTLEDIARAYDQLCTQHYGDACARRAGMCARAMDEYAHDTDTCGWGVGDGSWTSSTQRNSLLALCPRAKWTKEVEKVFAEDHAP